MKDSQERKSLRISQTTKRGLVECRTDRNLGCAALKRRRVLTEHPDFLDIWGRPSGLVH